MKKKALLLILCALLCISMLTAAGVREIGEDENIVRVEEVHLSNDGYSMLYAYRSDGVETIYHIQPETKLEGFNLSDVKAGDILVIKNNGIATMSIPPQMYATEIRDITVAVKNNLIPVTFEEKVENPAINAEDIPFSMDELLTRFSYSYGYLSAESLISQGLIVQGDYFARGIIDAIDFTQETLLSFEDMMLVTDEYYATVYSQGILGEVGNPIDIKNIESVKELASPSNLTEEFAYAYGYIIAYQVMLQGIELDRIAFPYGFLNRLYNTPAIISIEDMNQALNDYIDMMNEMYAEYYDQMAEENLKEAETFLSENVNKEGVIVINDGLQLEFVSRSESTVTPSSTDTVIVNYTLSLPDETVLESNDGVAFPLSQVIRGFTDAVLNMHIGDKAIAYIHPDAGYGEMGNGAIEPNQLLIFEIELVDIANN